MPLAMGVLQEAKQFSSCITSTYTTLRCLRAACTHAQVSAHLQTMLFPSKPINTARHCHYVLYAMLAPATGAGTRQNREMALSITCPRHLQHTSSRSAQVMRAATANLLASQIRDREVRTADAQSVAWSPDTSLDRNEQRCLAGLLLRSSAAAQRGAKTEGLRCALGHVGARH